MRTPMQQNNRLWRKLLSSTAHQFGTSMASYKHGCTEASQKIQKSSLYSLFARCSRLHQRCAPLPRAGSGFQRCRRTRRPSLEARSDSQRERLTRTTKRAPTDRRTTGSTTRNGLLSEDSELRVRNEATLGRAVVQEHSEGEHVDAEHRIASQVAAHLREFRSPLLVAAFEAHKLREDLDVGRLQQPPARSVQDAENAMDQGVALHPLHAARRQQHVVRQHPLRQQLPLLQFPRRVLLPWRSGVHVEPRRRR
mmetsp:Transcript_28817/g.92614  ORF Transcript_28817/g.92614 Transcript_28817/m.92614 type:complete len:252 (-) Transcript_28817:1506-2261(-)